MSQDVQPPQDPAGKERAAGKDELKKKGRSVPKWVPWAALAVCVVIGGIIAVYYYVHSLSHKSTDDAFIDGHSVAVAPRVSGHVAALCVADNEPVEKGRLLVALDPRDFQARFDAASAELAMAEANAQGANIDLELTKVTAAADYDAAISGVSSAKSAINTSEAHASAARSALAQAEADVNVAKAVAAESSASAVAAEAIQNRDAVDLRRYSDLIKTGAATPQQYDHAAAAASASAAEAEAARKKAAADTAAVTRTEAAMGTFADAVREAQFAAVQSQSGLDEARARLAAANTQREKVAAAEAKVRLAEAQVQQARAAAEQAGLELSYTKIYAPEAGRVTHRTVEAGAYIQTGQALLAIVQPEVWVTANFKETQLTRMLPGQPVDISVDAFPDKVFRGHIDSIQAGTGAVFSLLPPENATGNYIKVVQRIPVKIVFDEPVDQSRYYLVPGMSVVPDVNVSRPGRTHEWPKVPSPSVGSTAAR